MTKKIPVYAKGGFKVRDQKLLGFAASRAEAHEIVRANVPTIRCGANGHDLQNTPVGVEHLRDETGEYFVPVRQIQSYRP
jgi:hypothetical protein